MFGPLLSVQLSFRVAGARDCALYQKWGKREGFVAFPKTMAGVGHLKRIWKDAISRGRRSTRDMFIRDVRRSGRWFPERVAFWSIRSLVLGRWFCVTVAALRMTWHRFFDLFRGRRNTSETWGRQLCIQLSIIEGSLAELLRFCCCQRQKLRTSRKLASFFILPTSKIEEVSKDCFLFDVIKFKSWGNLAELLRFQACRLQIDR